MKIWIVVADEREALFYETGATDRVAAIVGGAERTADSGCRLVLKFTNPQGRPDRDLETDRPGRKHGLMGQRHGVDGERSTRRTDQEDFAKRIADAIDEARHSGAFERVVLAAGPRMLGMIRGALSDAARNAVAAEVAKDLVKFEGRDLMEHLPPEAKPKHALRV